MTACKVHTLIGPDTETATVKCEVCGYTEPADPRDVAEQRRILAEMDAAGWELSPLARAELLIEQLRESLARGNTE